MSANMTPDEDSDSSLKGYDPVTFKWVTVFRDSVRPKRTAKRFGGYSRKTHGGGVIPPPSTGEG